MSKAVVIEYIADLVPCPSEQVAIADAIIAASIAATIEL
jgi:hypothetical protein